MQDYKFIISIFTVLLVIISNWSYFRGMLYGTVRPHMYTFLIWIITQWIAVFGMIYGWAKWWIVWPTLSLLCMVWIVFLIWKKKLWFPIARSDTYALTWAVIALILWWVFDAKLISLFLATVVDICWYFPTFRKIMTHPSSEIVFPWIIFSFINITTILSSAMYNFYTVFYTAVILVCNMLVIALIVLKRK